MKIAEHFTLEEMTFSAVAARLGLDNSPSAAVTENLKLVAASMESIRELLDNKPIVVHSAYRSHALNAAVGGSARSAHCSGLACDFACPEFGTAAEVARAIVASQIAFDQLILEYGWIHVGLAAEGALPRREILTKRSPWAGYEPGLTT